MCALLLSAAVIVIGCRGRDKPELRKLTRLLMDTYITITAYAPAAKADKAIDDAFARLDTISRKFNHLDSTSPVYAFNHRGEPLVDSELVAVAKGALAVSEASGGAFDITVQPLVELWGFYGDHPAIPAQQAIDSCLRFVGYRYLIIRGDSVTKLKPEVTIDLGGIAKGYALKRAAEVMRADGVDSAVIDAGGDVFAIGRKGNRNWKVGIRDPRGDGLVGVTEVSNLAVVTSGDYERYFFGPDSVRYCHIIDPHTGWPAHGVTSATVVMRDPMLAQGWSKVLFIMGSDGLGVIGKVGGIEGLIIGDSMNVTMTPGLTGAVELTKPEPGD